MADAYYNRGIAKANLKDYVGAIADYDKAIELASKIDLVLSGRHIIDSKCKLDITLADSTETFEDNKYIETLVFSIK